MLAVLAKSPVATRYSFPPSIQFNTTPDEIFNHPAHPAITKRQHDTQRHENLWQNLRLTPTVRQNAGKMRKL
jgi:hypothetical protein